MHRKQLTQVRPISERSTKKTIDTFTELKWSQHSHILSSHHLDPRGICHIKDDEALAVLLFDVNARRFRRQSRYRDRWCFQVAELAPNS